MLIKNLIFIIKVIIYILFFSKLICLKITQIDVSYIYYFYKIFFDKLCSKFR